MRNRLLDPRRGDVVLILLAHPDDESIFTGGMIARLAAAGAQTILLTATLGELGRMQGELGRATELVHVRPRELQRACDVLGITEYAFLGSPGRWTDSGRSPATQPAGCLARSTEAAVLELSACLRAIRPHVVVTFDAHGTTGHPDHIACHAIALRAVARTAGPGSRLEGVAMIADTLPSIPSRSPLPSTPFSVDVGVFRQQQASALACHRSQGGGAAEDSSLLRSLHPRTAMARCLANVVSPARRARAEWFRWVPTDEVGAYVARVSDVRAMT